MAETPRKRRSHMTVVANRVAILRCQIKRHQDMIAKAEATIAAIKAAEDERAKLVRDELEKLG